MAVLVEGISVILRRAVCDAVLPGGWSAFAAQQRFAMLSTDDEIARIGFKDSVQVEACVRYLVDAGLKFVEDGTAVDMAVVDQLAGVTTPCEWLEFGQVTLQESGQQVAACRLVGSLTGQIVTPEHWVFVGSLTEKYGSVST